jgi:hypothetical protein
VNPAKKVFNFDFIYTFQNPHEKSNNILVNKVAQMPWKLENIKYTPGDKKHEPAKMNCYTSGDELTPWALILCIPHSK